MSPHPANVPSAMLACVGVVLTPILLPLFMISCEELWGGKQFPEDCDSTEAGRKEVFTAWCEDACQEGYNAGLAQGHDCATEESAFVAQVSAWHDDNPDPLGPLWGADYSPCDIPGGECGTSPSHSDNLAGAFDYGYYDGWLEAGCEGDPVGDDMTHLSWPILEGDTGPTYTPGYYPCPEVYLP